MVKGVHVSLLRFAGLTGLVFATTVALAAPSQPGTDTLQEKLAQRSKDPATLAAAVKSGEKAASVCRHCHGAGGNSVMPDVPNLAGQNAAYLVEQMNKFVLGTRKSSDFMTGLIKALSADERVDIALYLSQQPVVTQPATAGQGAAGKSLYAKLCINCHGAQATGTQKIPRLAGQQGVYLEDSLKRYRSGSGERIDPNMAAYTRNLKDADIRNLAGYLSTLQP
jgi:cytochrome c553